MINVEVNGFRLNLKKLRFAELVLYLEEVFLYKIT